MIVLDVAAFKAQAGQIFMFGGQIQGQGVLDAPVGVNVSIENNTLSTLQIEGINIPQNIGGVYINGALLTGASVAADNVLIGNQDVIPNAAAFSRITLSQPPAPPSPNTPPSAHIDIFNDQQFLTADEISNGVKQPDIIINGQIQALFADLTVFSYNDINITQTGGIDVYAQNLVSRNNITIDEVQFFASGDPASQILGAPVNGETELGGSNAAAQALIATYENTPRTTQLISQTIEIQSEYVDINGDITAGQAQQDLTINPADVAQQIQTIINERAGSPQLLTLPASANGTEAVILDANGNPVTSFQNFTVYYDPANGGSIEVQPVALGGGVIIIKGHVASTSTATLNAFGYYGSVNITNNTGYNLQVDGIDASQHGAGVVDITDLNQTQGSNVLETKYLSTQGGGMMISTNYVDPVTGAPAGSGSVVSQSSNSSQFRPEAGLRYNFSVEWGTQSVTSSTYFESNWIGIFNLGDGTLTAPPVTQTITQPTVLASSLYFYVDTANENTDYLYTTTSHQLADSGQVPGANWSTSTWYGKHTYYQSYTDTTKDIHIADTSIKADMPINIDFTGGSTSSVTINSPFSNVAIYGNIANLTGTTNITAGGTITTPRPKTTIEGVQVNLTGNGGIGISGQPVNVILAGGVNQSLTATTTNGAIFIATPQGSMTINSITAGGDQAVNISSFGDITVASGGTGVITGGNVTIAAGGQVGASGANIKLAVGQEAADQLNLTALNDVHVEQTSGNLPLFALTSTNGSAYITVDHGSVVNVNTNVQVDPRTTAQLLAGEWTALQLTDATGAQAKITATLTEYQLSQELQYQTYWKDRNALVGGVVQMSSAALADYQNLYTQQGAAQGLTGQALTNFVNNAISTIQLSDTQQYFSLAAIYGPGGSYNPGVTNVYNPVDGSTASAPIAYDPNTYDPNFVYLLTQTEKAALTGNIKVWTESELLSGISAGLLQTTTSTQINIEAPNISAKNIVITAGTGNVGSLVNPATNFNANANVIGFVVGTNIDQTPVQLAFASAQLSDLNFLAATPVSESVNFNGSSMILSNGSSWSSTGLNIQANQWLYIGGATQNATQNGAYLQVASVSGSTITFTNTVVTENNQTVLVAPVVTNLQSTDVSTAGPIVQRTVAFGNSGNGGTITLSTGTWAGYSVGGGIYIQSATDQNANGSGPFTAGASNAYYTIAGISADQKTLTLKWGQILNAESAATVGVAPVAINIQNGAAAVKFVLVSQSRDVAIAPTGSINSTAQGFIYLGSQVDLALGNVISTGNADVKIKTAADITSVATSGVNVQGSDIVLESGFGTNGIGTASSPITVSVGADGSLTARALNSIYIDAPSGDLPIQGITLPTVASISMPADRSTTRSRRTSPRFRPIGWRSRPVARSGPAPSERAMPRCRRPLRCTPCMWISSVLACSRARA